MKKKFFLDTKKYLEYIVDATKANLKSEVANSYLNWVWWILEPLCFMGIFYLVFGVFFHLKEEYFICFIMVGVSMWDFFNRMMKNSVSIMKASKTIVSKIYLPKHILIFVRIGVNGFKMIISFAIVTVMMIILKVEISWKILFFIPVLLLFIVFTFSISCFLLHFGVYVADLKNIVDIVLRFVFYLSGVFYGITHRIGGVFGEILLNVNPIAYFIDATRKVLLYETMPNLWVLLIWFSISVALSAIGIKTIYKNENSYVKCI